jgi:hypothetical protein
MEELCEKVPEAGKFVLHCKFLHPPPAAETNASKDPPSKKCKLDPKRTGVGGQDAHLPVLSGCERFPHHQIGSGINTKLILVESIEEQKQKTAATATL